MDREENSVADEVTVDEVGGGVEEIALPLGAGETLQATREKERLSLEHVAAETRIPIRHLRTIEAGRYEDLPSRTYAIGFARSYAQSVGLDGEDIADQVREELSEMGPRYSAVGQGMEPGDPAKLPSRGLAWFGGAAALILAIGAISFGSNYFGAGDSLGSLLVSEESSEESGAPAEETALAASDVDGAAPVVSAEGAVVFTALEDGVWVRFYEQDGERLFEAQMASGDTFELPSSASEPRINTGRPDALAITIGGRSVPKLSEEPVTMGDTPISAAALLAREDT